MSFKPEYNKVYEAMRTGGKLTRRKNEIQRVSEQPGDYIITSRIEESINNAGIIICDVSELSPNVYYELGFARAQKKTIIMTARAGTSLPFDVRQYRTNFYSDEMELQEIIKKELLHYFSTRY